jgi:opacity protein-like surface antigen
MNFGIVIMRKTPFLVAAFLGAVFLPGPLQAADLLPPAPSFDQPLLDDAPLGVGWYLRGDVGVGSTRLGRARLRNAPAFSPYERRKIDPAFSLGAGAGYQFNSWFRADVTAEHRFDARVRGYNRNPGLAAGLIETRAEFSATTVLANAYLDLGTWYRMTPYIGAGLGFSAKSLRNAEMRTGTTSLGILQGSHTRTDVAWALMAGVGVEMGHNAVLDLNYRYLHLGSAGTKPGAGVVSAHLGRIASHEFRAGLRWHFGN